MKGINRDKTILCLLGVGMSGLAGIEKEGESAFRPNILFALADDLSFPHTSAYGCSWVKTPGFDRVAAEGLLFNNAYTPNAKCGPSRGCILTGRNSWQLEEAANHWCFIPDKYVTFMEALEADGYFIGFSDKGWEPGVPSEGRLPTGKRYSLEMTPPTSAIRPVDYAGSFSQFLDEKEPEQSFCFWYGSFDPHRPYEFGSGISKGGKRLSDIDRVPAYWPDNETVRTEMLDYAYATEYFDLHLQKMIAELERRGLLENTIIVVTSDNGMPFPRVKSNVYDASVHMPLAVMWKEGIVSPGRVIDDYVSFIDFAPTFLELAGVEGESAGMQPVQGRSLLELFRTDRSGRVVPERDHVLLGRERHDVGRPDDQGYPVRGIVSNGWLYLRNLEPDRWPQGDPQTGYSDMDGSSTKTTILNSRVDPEQPMRFWDLCFGKRPAEELYHLASDPDCVRNLAGQAAHQGMKRMLQTQLLSQLESQHDPRMFGEGAIFDLYRHGRDYTRNYYNRYMQGEQIEARWINETDFEPDFPRRAQTTENAR
jgi:N-sulfoglucosamine sulfohydrolase